MITLIGKNIAEKELKFIFYGGSKECESCRFKNTCIDSLQKGRMYIISDVKDTEHQCPIHEGKIVKVVEVENAEIKALIDSKKAFEGSTIEFDFPECDVECTMKDLCFPEGLYKGDKCKIAKTLGKPENKCIKELDLSLVHLKY